MLNTYKDNQTGILCASHRGELGNPVIFSNCYKEELMQLKGDVGGKKVLKKHLADVTLFDTLSGVDQDGYVPYDFEDDYYDDSPLYGIEHDDHCACGHDHHHDTHECCGGHHHDDHDCECGHHHHS